MGYSDGLKRKWVDLSQGPPKEREMLCIPVLRLRHLWSPLKILLQALDGIAMWCFFLILSWAFFAQFFLGLSQVTCWSLISLYLDGGQKWFNFQESIIPIMMWPSTQLHIKRNLALRTNIIKLVFSTLQCMRKYIWTRIAWCPWKKGPFHN
jgi:hypothetical protein